MARHHFENFIELMCGEGGARRAGFFPPDFLAVELEDVVGLEPQQRDLFLGETVREKDVALLVESLELFRRELHGRRSLYLGGRCPARRFRSQSTARAEKCHRLARRQSQSWRGAARARKPRASAE